ncbi:hypothetical protein HanIR_Chr16g0789031 [Helianthus annuus]|nr:hypothetical protein HanIR_Chr16g0789031 [Helianthus annuus]
MCFFFNLYNTAMILFLLFNNITFCYLFLVVDIFIIFAFIIKCIIFLVFIIYYTVLPAFKFKSDTLLTFVYMFRCVHANH